MTAVEPFNPSQLPPGALPVEITSTVALYWYPVDLEDNLDYRRYRNEIRRGSTSSQSDKKSFRARLAGVFGGSSSEKSSFDDGASVSTSTTAWSEKTKTG